MKEMGFVIVKTTSRLVLKQVPSALRALPWAHMFASITAQIDCADSAYLVRKSISEQFVKLNPPSHANVAKTLESLSAEALNDLLHERSCRMSLQDLAKLYSNSQKRSET
jgi:hypothetical protein